MDPFAQKILQRAEKRNKVLETMKGSDGKALKINNSMNYEAKVPENESQVTSRKQDTTDTATFTTYENKIKKSFKDKENSEYDIEINITTRPDVEVQIEVREEHADNNQQQQFPTSSIRETSRNRLHRLGALYSNEDGPSSPITRNELFEDVKNSEENKRIKQRTNKLVDLANTIRVWEHNTTPINKAVATSKPAAAPEKGNQASTAKRVETEKKVNWSKNVLNSLEVQGFQRKLSIDPKELTGKQNDISVDSNKAILTKERLIAKNSPTTIANVSSGTIATNTAHSTSFPRPNISQLTTKFQHKITNNVKDPTELSLKERMQLFEKNKGEPVGPKGFVAKAAPVSKTKETFPDKYRVATTSVKNKIDALTSCRDNSEKSGSQQKVEQVQKTDVHSLANRFENGVVNRHPSHPTLINQNKPEIPVPPPMPPVARTSFKRPSLDSNNANESSMDDNKKVRISDLSETEKASNNLYPTLSKLKSMEFSTELDLASNSERKENDLNRASEGKETCSDENKYGYDTSSGNSSVNSLDLTGCLSETDDKDSVEVMEYESCNTHDESEDTESPIYAANTASRVKENCMVLPTNGENGTNVVTLVHTVSFYRRQQTSNNKIGIKSSILETVTDESSSSELKDEFHRRDNDGQSETVNSAVHAAQEKIERLLTEVCKQQQIIAQTSQALNLCASTIEFSGSTESVEGERHLLVATHRRQAALDEIQRLRIEKTIRPIGAIKDKGRLTVRDITVPLRSEYIRKLSSETISGHHLVCMLKYNENVLATKTVPTLPGLISLRFPDLLQLNDVYADFRITLEIYGMTAQREVLPHEIKYHINLNKKSAIRTPKKKLKESSMISPMTPSSTVSIVRTPAFVQYGFAIFSLREIQRSVWTLSQVSAVSPLDGTINMKLDCELYVAIQYSGFLTMFEEISNFGAWHRRWCRLDGHVLNYWKYPDDEKKKAPIGSIDLYSCCSQEVRIAPRDLCARLNTLLLECRRPPQDDDFESLIIVPKGTVTIVRHFLSADTKDERDEWSAQFNKALSLIRT